MKGIGLRGLRAPSTPSLDPPMNNILIVHTVNVLDFFAAVCDVIKCENDATCVAPNKCQCKHGFVGVGCQHAQFGKNIF